MRRILPCLLLLLGACLLLAACGAEPVPAPAPDPFVRVARPVMGTEASITIYAADPAPAYDAAAKALDEIERLEAVLSDYDPESELMRLCAADHAEPVPVGRDLYEALTLALDLARRTRGLYDPTVGAYTHLWREAKARGTRPTDAALSAARARVGWQQVELHPPTRSVRFRVEGMQLDLGGFGKGYAAQAAWAMLGMAGFSRCLVDVGGDIVAGAPPEGQAGWTIMLEGAPPLVIRDRAVAASGPGERGVEVEGIAYGHILDPRTGLAVTNGQSSVVIAPDAASADVFATVLCILPIDEGLATAAGTDGVEAGVRLPDEALRTTPGFATYRAPERR